MIAAAVCVAAGASACSQATPGVTGTVSALSTRIEVGVDGGLDVHEILALVPADGRIELIRTVEASRADAIAFVAASVDDIPIEPDGNGLAVTRHDPRRLSVTWQAGSRQAPARLSLHYRVTAAVAAREPRGRLEWTVLAPGRGFDVGDADITLVLPDGVRTYDGTGMAEAGWSVEFIPRGIAARRGPVPADEGATMLAVFDIDHARVVPPEWEWDADRQAQYFLALLAAGAFIVVIGVGALVLIRVQYPPVPREADAGARAAAISDRQMLARGLKLAGWSGLVFSALCAVLAEWTLSGLGPAVQFIPASMAGVFMMLLVASLWYSLSVRRMTPLPRG
jgi:hypothetical protein